MLQKMFLESLISRNKGLVTVESVDKIDEKNYSIEAVVEGTCNSIEKKINKMQERKEKLSKDVLSTEETFVNKMSKEEILDLFE